MLPPLDNHEIDQLRAGLTTLSRLRPACGPTIQLAWQVAVSFVQVKRWREAASLVEGLLVLEPDEPQFLHALGVLKLEQGARDDARRYLERAQLLGFTGPRVQVAEPRRSARRAPPLAQPAPERATQQLRRKPQK